jgi:hypothetical protein
MMTSFRPLACRYCNSHLQLLGLLPRKSKQGMGLESGSETSKSHKRALGQDGKAGKSKAIKLDPEAEAGMCRTRIRPQ